MTSASDKRCGFKLQPNVVLEVVNTSIRVLVVPGSNLRPETGITIEVFRGIRQFLQAGFGIISQIDRGRFLSHSFQLIIRLSCVCYIMECVPLCGLMNGKFSGRHNCINYG